MKIYKSKQDLWLMLIIYISSLISLCASVYVLTVELSVTTVLISVLIFSVGGLMQVWLVFSLRYKIDDTFLRISCGPFKWQIEISSIQSVVPTTDMISSPALSLDRLLITYGSGKVVLVSPEDKEGFLGSLGINSKE